MSFSSPLRLPSTPPARALFPSAGTGSVFDEVFDVAVIGAGYVGLGAVEALRGRGLRILVVEPSGQLLWESTRALANGAPGAPGCAAWARWLGGLRARGAADDRFLDPAFAEIRVHRDWSDDAGVRTLFYAQPAGVESDAGGIRGVTLATKAGCRRIRARHWIDATENGLLAVLDQPGERGARRAPAAHWHGLVAQAPEWAGIPEPPAALGEWGGSLRPTERRLRWQAGPRPWHEEMTGRLERLRDWEPVPSRVIVSQCSAEPYPVYASEDSGVVRRPGRTLNLTVLSPVFSDGEYATPAERFARGAAGAESLVLGAPARSRAGGAAGAPLVPEPLRTIVCDVLVAGAGTAGALAAISAARSGAKTCAIEFAAYPGGVGTGGGITGYFHGLEGGLQGETDRLTGEMSRLLEGRDLARRRWHHEGKKLALFRAFATHGVEFHGGALLCAVETDGAGGVRRVIAATAEGPVAFVARAFVDCTGDGDLCALAGAAYSSGRAGDGRTLAYSQSAFVLKSEPEGLSVASCNFDSGWTDPTDPEELSRARTEGVLQHEQPLWSAAKIPLAVAPLPGVRQSRHIETDYALSFGDLVDHARFADCVGEAGSIADTHSVDFEFEDDEAVFFFWVCRLFRHGLRTQFPYRMMMPRGLRNVWIACRAAGMAVTASYAVRMQRDMQRLGEVAGRAAAFASERGLDARGAGIVFPVSPASPPPTEPSPLEAMLSGRPGLHLWRLYRRPDKWRPGVARLLESPVAAVSFYAAAIMAMWEDEAAEPRLLAAIATREEGPPASAANSGAHGQEIDVPFWLIAIVLLRRCGTARCLAELASPLANPEAILNVRTAIGLTAERLLALGRIDEDDAVALAERLLRHPLPDARLAPSRSIWRTLRQENQIVLRNDTGVAVIEDHAWQLHLVVARIRALAGLPLQDEARAYLGDSRAHVARVFALVSAAPRHTRPRRVSSAARISAARTRVSG